MTYVASSLELRLLESYFLKKLDAIDIILLDIFSKALYFERMLADSTNKWPYENASANVLLSLIKAYSCGRMPSASPKSTFFSFWHCIKNVSSFVLYCFDDEVSNLCLVTTFEYVLCAYSMAPVRIQAGKL